jgi:hypothetical protein
MQEMTLHRLAATTELPVLRGRGWLDHRRTIQVVLAVDTQTLNVKGRYPMA